MKPAAWGCALLYSAVIDPDPKRAGGRRTTIPPPDLHFPDFVIYYNQSDREVVPWRLCFLWCRHYPGWCRTPIHRFHHQNLYFLSFCDILCANLWKQYPVSLLPSDYWRVDYQQSRFGRCTLCVTTFFIHTHLQYRSPALKNSSERI